MLIRNKKYLVVFLSFAFVLGDAELSHALMSRNGIDGYQYYEIFNPDGGSVKNVTVQKLARGVNFHSSKLQSRLGNMRNRRRLQSNLRNKLRDKFGRQRVGRRRLRRPRFHPKPVRKPTSTVTRIRERLDRRIHTRRPDLDGARLRKKLHRKFRLKRGNAIARRDRQKRFSRR